MRDTTAHDVVRRDVEIHYYRLDRIEASAQTSRIALAYEEIEPGRLELCPQCSAVEVAMPLTYSDLFGPGSGDRSSIIQTMI